MNTIFFDLDGTLLPMDQDKFVEIYFQALAQKCIPLGFRPEDLIKGIWAGTRAMIENDGTLKNEERFWDTFSAFFGEDVRKLEPEFEQFYKNEFNLAKEAAAPTPYANECVQILKEKGYKLILSTNPIFPQVATYQRMEWAGISPEDFDLITTYENSVYCKPNLNYYKDILNTIGKEAHECMMVGNDVKEDMCTKELGMDTYLLTDCLISDGESDFSYYKSGNFKDLIKLVKGLPNIL
ncbi:phosphoglycolate phosphatase-like HAD superfamily hydrolase [Mobilisporobacter senegalensis]|uniref:Phosphoglycolate phosphatase-like HAD superfamily hydrolase n=1 Tax=Mobilisporobacter senegalensis TaxID=1329262 RepID=A0A3N1XZH7_9FIRM|nr:HAD family hydrolase [Mobilisporobacter senegalensis]ROR30652.1 phosphoglycolate phosphatase-like HAD superfamily hydrolase [Mobilisporobacter senegalensis]